MKHQPTIPSPPPAWLVAQRYSETGRLSVVGAFPSRNDTELLAMEKAQRQIGPTEILLDQPSLEVYGYGITIANASWLTVRDNWFQRYASVLEHHLRDPAIAQVFTFDTNRLPDPLTTHKSSPRGPFPLTKGVTWPRCGFCDTEMAFLGLLDFREFQSVAMPNGSLVLHVCN